MERAVSAVAVAITSGLWARPQILRKRWANSRPNSSWCGCRLAAKEWQSQEVGNDWLESRAGRGDAAIAVVGLCEKAVGDGVYHHVARARIESRDLFSGCSRRDRCEICNAADVVHDMADLFVAIEQVVEKWNQRCAFASGGHVGGAEVETTRNSGSGGEDRAFSGLPGVGQVASQKLPVRPGGRASVRGSRSVRL